METFLGISREDIMKIKHLQDKYCLTIDELIGCFDVNEVRLKEIKRLEGKLEDLRHEQRVENRC